MRIIQFFIALIICVSVCGGHLSDLLAVDRKERVKAGQRFLNKSRVDRWERYFSEGLPKLGKIVTRLDGETVTESWFDGDFWLVKHLDGEKSLLRFSNPDYSAMVESHKGKHTLLGAGAAAPNSRDLFMCVGGVSFAICSSVNFTRQSIPRFLQQGKLKISDYRFEEEKHFVELAFVDETQGNSIELVFYDNNPSMLPNEAIFNKLTVEERHFKNSEFVNVEGYFIPSKGEELGPAVSEKGFAACVMIEVFPQERLNPEWCRLPYYGLPEPNLTKVKVADFGRKRGAWQWIVSGCLFVIASIALLWSYKKSSRR